MLPAIVTQEEFDALDETIQKEYKPREGDDATGFLLDVGAVSGHELTNVTGLKTALETERHSNKTLKDQAKAFDGLNPTDSRAAIAKVAEMKDWQPEEKIEEGIKAREQALISAHESERQKDKEEKDFLEKELKKHLVENAVTEAIQKQKGSIGLLLPHVTAHVNMRKTDNGFIAEVIDPRTKVARIGDGQGNPMTIPELVTEIKNNPDFSGAFEGSGASGTGATGEASNAGDQKKGVDNAGGKAGKIIEIKRSDQAAINANFEKIASGEAVVVDG